MNSVVSTLGSVVVGCYHVTRSGAEIVLEVSYKLMRAIAEEIVLSDAILFDDIHDD